MLIGGIFNNENIVYKQQKWQIINFYCLRKTNCDYGDIPPISLPSSLPYEIQSQMPCESRRERYGRDQGRDENPRIPVFEGLPTH